jgi:hypothetical protein
LAGVDGCAHNLGFDACLAGLCCLCEGSRHVAASDGFRTLCAQHVVVSLCSGILLSILYRLGMCVILGNILEQCSLFLPLRWGAGSMALMLWLNW